MPTILGVANLLSRTIRTNASKGRFGSEILSAVTAGEIRSVKPRKLSLLSRYQQQKDSKGKILGFIWNASKVLVGFIGKLLGVVSFSFSAAWGWLIGTIEQIKAFNWNASDKQLESLIANQNVALAAAWGGFVGQGLGWITGIGVGYGIGYLCPVIGGALLAKKIAGEVAIEGAEEISASLRNALSQTAKALVNSTLIKGYIGFRRFLKAAPLKVLEGLFGSDQAKFIKNQWGAEGGPDLSFNARMDEFVENIDNNVVQAFVENLLEEAWDGFTEAGFIVAQELDDAFAQAKLAANRQLGPDRTIEIVPDKAADSEKLVFQNLPQNLLMPAVQTSLNQHRLIHNRDIGLVMGLPAEEYVKSRPQSLRIVIELFSVKEPPFKRRVDDNFREVTITIPDLKRSALDWQQIKMAVGGSNGYLWGRFKANATLDNGRRITVYGATEEEANERIKAILLLTSAEMQTLSITEEKKEGERLRKRKLYKETTRVYPAYMTILNREELLDPSRGRATLGNNYRDVKARIPLYTQTEPKGFSDQIASLLRKGF